MEIYLIRHTKPVIEAGTCYGQTDIPLAPSFEEELKILRKKLPESFDIIYTSPLQRCRLLAEKLQSKTRCIDQRLLEVNFGTWEMKLWNDMGADSYQLWLNDFVNVKPPGGESFQELLVRVKNFLDELKETSYDKVALVTHAGFIRTAVAHVLGLPLENAFRMSFDYGTVSLLKLNEGQYRLYFLNK
jgi:alpha-ribazole phosphatase